MASEILSRILDDIKTAMKAHDTETLSTLRTLHSDIKNVSINAGNGPAAISDEIVLDVLAKSLKQKNEAIELLLKGGFEDKANAERASAAIFQKYLPAPFSEEEVVALIEETKKNVGATSQKDMGKMMKELSPKLKGRFDSKQLSQLVQKALA